MDKWWKSLLWGVGFLAAGIFVFTYLDGKERSGESFRLQWMFALLYDAVGKWGVVGLFLAIALGFVIRSLIQRRRPPVASPLPPAPFAQPGLPPSGPGEPTS
jgi:hypothetical protein